jgi:tRNA modification GTPase
MPHVALSATTGDGIPALEARIADEVFSGRVVHGDSPISSSPRHRDLFRRALEHVQDALSAQEQGMPDDLVAIDVSEAVQVLGEVTGETASEDLLDTIFADFCIGK